MKTENITILPLAPGDTAASAFGLPADLQEKACRRVAQFSLLMAAIVAIVFLVSRPVWQDFTAASAILIVRIMQAALFVLSIVVFLIARSPRVGHTAVLYLGLVYEFLFCLIVSIGYNWFTAEAYGIFAAITLSSIVIACYPMVVPSPTVPTLVTALASAAAAPVGLFFVAVFGEVEVHPADYLGVSTYPFLCVALAVLGSRIIYGLNREVASARELGSYRLREVLGTGGMGEVWRAEHRMLARPAAVKIIRSETGGGSSSGGSQTQKRFEREAQVTASLQSPHTVALFDFGRTDAGTYYYVMELLDGIDLQTLVERFGPIPAERVCYLLRQACRSLGEAHDAGLIHRDIKPANILTCRYSREFDFVKVLDFGLVALRSDPGSNDPKLTAQGVVGGTPAYLSPEVAQGLPADGRADLYALGCVAYWLLTGRAVFEGSTPMAVMLAHMRDRPTPPSAVSETPVPAPLEDVIMRCLEKDPARRPASADELRDLLGTCVPDNPWTAERARRWWETHRPAHA